MGSCTGSFKKNQALSPQKEAQYDQKKEQQPFFDDQQSEQGLQLQEFCLAEDPKTTPTKSMNRMGVQHFKQRQFAEAECCFRQALEQNLQNPNIHYNLAKTLYKAGKFQQSILFYESCLKINEVYQKALRGLSSVLLKLKKFDESISCSKKAIQINPKNALSYYKLGLALQKSNQNYEAIYNFQKAVELNSKQFTYYSHLGNTLKKVQRFDESIENYLKAIKLNSKCQNAYSNLGNMFYKKKQTKQAVEYYGIAAELKPSPIRHFNYGRVLEKDMRVRQAYQQYMHCLKLDPNFQKAHTCIKKIQCNQRV